MEPVAQGRAGLPEVLLQGARLWALVSKRDAGARRGANPKPPPSCWIPLTHLTPKHSASISLVDSHLVV